MNSRFLQPSSEGLRKPTDNAKQNGFVINVPRYAELGGLDGARRCAPGVNNAPSDIGNPLNISKPGGGRL